MSLFYELYWLDLFPAGTIIPPNAIAPALASLTVMDVFAVTKPSVAAVIMLAVLPLGRLFARVERYHRQYENEAFTRLIRWVKKPDPANRPAALTAKSVLVLFPANLAAFALVVTILLVLAGFILPRITPSLAGIGLKWPHLWVVASIGPLLSLRHRPAYVLLAAGVVLAVLMRLVA